MRDKLDWLWDDEPRQVWNEDVEYVAEQVRSMEDKGPLSDMILVQARWVARIAKVMDTKNAKSRGKSWNGYEEGLTEIQETIWHVQDLLDLYQKLIPETERGQDWACAQKALEYIEVLYELLKLR